MKSAKRCPRHAGDPGDNSPRSFLHGQPRIKHLLAGRIARVPRRGRPSVLRASHRPLFATGNRNSFSADRTSARGYLAPRRLTDTPCQDSAMRNSSPSSPTSQPRGVPSPRHLEPGLRVGEQARADECARSARRHVDRDMTYVPTLRDASRVGAMGNYVNENAPCRIAILECVSFADG